MPNSPGKPLSSDYVIAEPQTYDFFDISAAKNAPAQTAKTSEVDLGLKESAQKTLTDKPQRKTAREPWSDANKGTPKVKDADKDKFEPPDEDSEPAVAAGAWSTIEKFAASREALDESTSGQGIPREKRAVWVVHGMGQQIPFETLDNLANGLLDVLPNQQVKPRFRTVKIADQVLQRVELDIDGSEKDKAGNLKQYELHLYETYWAPKTEGVARLQDVVSFLWDGGLRGILNSFKSFRRAMFEKMEPFRIHWLTPLWLCLTLLILVALTAINAVILAAGGAQTGLAPLAFFKAHWGQLTALASCMVAVAFSFGALLFVADLWKPQELTTLTRILIGSFCWFAMACTIANIVVTAALLSLTLHADWVRSASKGCANSPGFISACITNTSSCTFFEKVRNCVVCLLEKIPCEKLQGFATVMILVAALLVAGTMITRAILRSSERRLQSNPWLLFFLVSAFVLNVFAFIGPVLMTYGPLSCWKLPAHFHFLENPAWVWPFLIFFSAKVREILVQYVGDVAIYVRPNKLDRFDEVRTKIKEAARSVVSALFTAYAPNSQPGAAPEFQYDKIALVGHSLGSVIAYDTLNRLMLDDWLSDGALEVAERTATMVTFGSPLNKTAFLFTIQGKDTLHIRERLASTVQPLILSYPKFRKLKWVNVYSRNDIVSGDLKFYDLPGYQDDPVPAVAVQNIKDRDAAVPLVAHVAYWKNKTVWQTLLSQIAPGTIDPPDDLVKLQSARNKKMP